MVFYLKVYTFLGYLISLFFLAYPSPLKISTDEDFIYRQLKLMDKYLMHLCEGLTLSDFILTDTIQIN